MKLTFKIHEHHEPGAGIEFNGDTVTVEVESGDPGGDDGEFTEHMRVSLAEWYDNKVELIEEPEKYGCHCDLEEGMEPDDCVIDSGRFKDCAYAKPGTRKEQCHYWRKV